jgi:hypothetical protein
MNACCLRTKTVDIQELPAAARLRGGGRSRSRTSLYIYLSGEQGKIQGKSDFQMKNDLPTVKKPTGAGHFAKIPCTK